LPGAIELKVKDKLVVNTQQVLLIRESMGGLTKQALQPKFDRPIILTLSLGQHYKVAGVQKDLNTLFRFPRSVSWRCLMSRAPSWVALGPAR
jgi:hypothetical protein